MAISRGPWLITLLTLVVAAAMLAGCVSSQTDTDDSGQAGRTLLVFAGAASKPPTEELAAMFEQQTGASVDVNFGGSGTMLSEMEIAEHGDVYFPGSSDWMDVAIEKSIVDPETEERVVYLVSSINVQAGNPKNINTLEDLLRDGVRVAIANPETVCVGAYAVEILEKNFTAQQRERFRSVNLVNWADSCEKTANAISLKAADAVIGWSVFEAWDPARIETVDLEPDELIRVAYIPIAVSTYAREPELAQDFIDFVTSEEGIEVFRRHGYFIEASEAQQYVGADEELPVGGWFDVPEAWLTR